MYFYSEFFLEFDEELDRIMVAQANSMSQKLDVEAVSFISITSNTPENDAKVPVSIDELGIASNGSSLEDCKNIKADEAKKLDHIALEVKNDLDSSECDKDPELSSRSNGIDSIEGTNDERMAIDSEVVNSKTVESTKDQFGTATNIQMADSPIESQLESATNQQPLAITITQKICVSEEPKRSSPLKRKAKSTSERQPNLNRRSSMSHSCKCPS